MDDLKAEGAILLARSSTAKRKRFSIAHELGHFLLPSHSPNSEGFSCSHGDLASSDTAARDRHAQVEAEANRFAAHLLMPPKKIRANMASPRPDLAEVVRLSDAFFVSKEAMARSYVDAHREPLALVFLHHGIVRRFYAAERFPYLEVGIGLPAPEHSIAGGIGLGDR